MDVEEAFGEVPHQRMIIKLAYVVDEDIIACISAFLKESLTVK
jgi:hypothetical protein